MGARDLAIRHLLALRAVAEHGSTRRAADALGYSQAAVSQQIAMLERSLGVTVLERVGGPRPARLTDAGREVLATADELLPRIDLLDERLRLISTGKRGRLSIGTFQAVSANLLPEVLAAIARDEPEVSVHVVESDDNAELIEHLVSGALDATFLVGPIHDSRIELEEVCRDPFIAVVAADGPDAATASFTLAELADRPLLGHQQCACHRLLERGFADAGISPAFSFRSNDNAAVQAMVRAGIGIAVMPMLSMNAADAGTRLVPIADPLPERTILIAWPRDRESALTRRFVERTLSAEPPSQLIGGAAHR